MCANNLKEKNKKKKRKINYESQCKKGRRTDKIAHKISWRKKKEKYKSVGELITGEEEKKNTSTCSCQSCTVALKGSSSKVWGEAMDY